MSEFMPTTSVHLSIVDLKGQRNRMFDLNSAVLPNDINEKNTYLPNTNPQSKQQKSRANFDTKKE